MPFLILLSIVVIGVWYYMSKYRFNTEINDLTDCTKERIISDNLIKEIERIETLKNNLKEVKNNANNLEIPIPEHISTLDDGQSSLNKISQYFEKHSTATAGIEQSILFMLPSSQLEESMKSLAQIVPPNIGHEIFGDAFANIKDGIHSIPTTEFLHRFIEGSTHLSDIAMLSMKRAMAHDDLLGALLVPIKSGLMEALRINDAAQSLVVSLKDVGSEIVNSATSTIEADFLENTTNFDISSHIPVITIALSSFRELQLLKDSKTNFNTSFKNITLDAFGAGGGAIGGQLVGFAVGSFLGPIGVIPCGIIGRIGGAMIGRNISNRIKIQPLKKAISEYEKQYSQMKIETNDQSKSTAQNIQSYAELKKTEFQDSTVLTELPIADSNQTVSQTAFILYQFIENDVIEMKTRIKKLRKSVWYSPEKHSNIVSLIETEVDRIEKLLPPVDYMKTSPKDAIETLINIQISNRKTNKKYQDLINTCSKKLKTANDESNSSVLIWSYMVNNLYQKTLNDIAEYSNSQMEYLSDLFKNWKETLTNIENRIINEQNKLGIKQQPE